MSTVGVILFDDDSGSLRLRYALRFRTLDGQFNVASETLDILGWDDDAMKSQVYSYHGGPAFVTQSSKENGHTEQRDIEIHFQEGRGLNARDSILSQLRDPIQYGLLTYFADSLGHITIYRGFDTAKYSSLRQPQRADLPNQNLLEDGSNLGLVLNRLEMQGQKRRIVEILRRFYERTADYTIQVLGNTVQFYLHEEGLSQPISASRLSDGILQFLCLVAILVSPPGGGLICIEEPEVGLHPDAMLLIAELLVEASQRTQIIVTTHSEALVSALSQTPEAIIVCERDQDGTKLRRLEAEQLREWLERYTLGDLWRMGEIGGTRW